MRGLVNAGYSARVGATALVGIGVFAATPGLAGTYEVGRVVIVGNRSVPTARLMAAVREHRGSVVSEADILADRDAILAVMSDAKVVGSVTVSISTLGKLSKVTFAVEDHGVARAASTAVAVAPRLDGQVFQGNGLIPSATLAAASGLVPGDALDDARIAAAGKSILAAYRAVNAPIGVSISVATKALADGTVDLIWRISELRSRQCTSSNLNLCNNPFK